MKATAARLIAHGEALQIADVDLPPRADDEVIVDLRFAGLNPVDRYVAEGKVAPDGRLPRTIGNEATGFVDGAPVLVTGEGLGSVRDGVFASAAVVPKASVYQLPAGVALDEAAALGIVGLTAWRLVELAAIGASDNVLVLGASGGTGQSVVSYAAAKGARVWGQTTSADKADAITEFGAVAAIVSDADGLVGAASEVAPTVVIDPLGGAFTSSALMAIEPRGRYVLFGTSAGTHADIDLRSLYRRQIQLHTYGGLIATREERRVGLAGTIKEFAAGRLRIRVGRRVSLVEVNTAIAALADRSVVGKIILDVGSTSLG